MNIADVVWVMIERGSSHPDEKEEKEDTVQDDELDDGTSLRR